VTIKTAGKVVLAFASRINEMKAGFIKSFTAKQRFTVGGVSMTQAQILAKLAQIGGIDQAVAKARSALSSAVAAKRADMPAARAFLSDLDQTLRQNYGRLSPALSSFGISLPKPRKARTAQEKVVSSAQGKATRKVHGVMGSKQRAAITVEGKPGLVLVDAHGQPVAGALTGPTPPGSGKPVDASGAVSQSPAADATSPSGGTPTGK